MAALYAVGWDTVATKLGTGAVALATGGEGRASEVGVLVGDVADLATGKRKDDKAIKTVADAAFLLSENDGRKQENPNSQDKEPLLSHRVTSR